MYGDKSGFLSCLASTNIVSHFNVSHSCGGLVASHGGFILRVLITNGVEHLTRHLTGLLKLGSSLSQFSEAAMLCPLPLSTFQKSFPNREPRCCLPSLVCLPSVITVLCTCCPVPENSYFVCFAQSSKVLFWGARGKASAVCKGFRLLSIRVTLSWL